jgi:hypothetical protein
MYALLICVAATAVGIDGGWRRMPEGGMEYIIQIEPEMLDALRAGKAVQSDIPPAAGEVRSYRVIVGTATLPRETPPAPSQPTTPVRPNVPDRKESQLAAPRTLTPDPAGKPLSELPAIFVEQPGTTPAAKSQSQPSAETQPETPPKPWLPLTVTLLGLFASLGTNVYLGWIAWDSRHRYRAEHLAAN